MKSYLVSLVSQQTIPNILGIREMKKMDGYIFLYTNETVEKMDMITAITGIVPPQIITTLVDAVELQNVYLGLDKLGLNKSDEFYINLTCGTKIMALTAFRFFVDFPHAKMMYFGSEDKTYQFIFPDIQIAQPIKYQMGIEEYILGNGSKILSNKHTITRSYSFSKKYFEDFISNDGIYPEAYKTIQSIRQGIRMRKIKDTSIIPLESIREGKAIPSLRTFRFLQKNQTSISEREWKYLDHAWLEEYVYGKVLEKNKLSRTFIAHHVNIQYENSEQERNLRELDVFFMHNCTPYCIECKTTVKNGEDFSKVIFKLNALKKILGLDLKLVLVILIDIQERFGKQTKDNPFARAEKHEITVIDKVALKNGALDQYLEQVFEK
ncbi:MAG: hypothetical protein ACI94Y_003598 [Maribacter sp.]|jgi:hypothetical protein